MNKKAKDLVKILYKRPKPDTGVNKPHFPDFKDMYYQQADLLFLPNDDGYRYALVVVDVGSRMIDARPLRSKTQNEILKAFKNIYKGKILKQPTNVISFDAGKEFGGVVKDYFENELGIHIKIAKPDRHKQQAIVERKNRDIGRYLFERMTAEELQTGEVSPQWVEYLPKVIKLINDRTKVKHKRTIDKKLDEEYKCSGDACKLLDQGTKVRAMLDAPREVYNMKKLHGRFRAGDIRFDPKIRTIKKTLIAPSTVPMYLLDDGKDGVDYSVAYTKSQIQVVNEKEIKPTVKQILPQNEDGIKKWHVDKLHDRKKENGRIYFKTSWKGFKDFTWEPRTNLMKDVPDLVLAYEKKKN